ncbi:hypothetical protein ACFLZH_04430 [Patescibacteria group bacterium]
MEQKVVKFEIGKVFAVVLTVIVVAVLATMALQGGYFKGELSLKEVPKEETVTREEAVVIMGDYVAKGGDAVTAVANYVATTGDMISVAEQEILAVNLELTKTMDPKQAVAIIDDNLEAIAKGDYVFTIKTEDAMRKAFGDLDFQMKQIDEDWVMTKGKDFDTVMTDFEKWLTVALADYKWDVVAFAKLRAAVKTDVVKLGVPFSEAFKKHLSTFEGFVSSPPKGFGEDYWAMFAKSDSAFGKMLEGEKAGFGDRRAQVLGEFEKTFGDGALPGEQEAISAFMSEWGSFMPKWGDKGYTSWDLEVFAQEAGVPFPR